jgi:adenylate cyclase
MAEAKRKLAAILAADVANYSRLMGADEEGTVAALDACRAIFQQSVESHDGEVVDTAGDSVLATFDSVVQAVRCSVEIQKALAARDADLAEEQRMRFRIGINLGDVITKSDGTIYGDGVNVAARLESLAEPGGITVSGPVFDHAENKVPAEFEFTGEQTVKNIAKPVRAYRVIAETTPAASPSAHMSLTLPDKPSIAVLPFNNLSGDPDQDYLADGVAEDLITALSRVRWMFVTARNSSFAYKGRSPDVKQVGKELGVRYVVEGSVRKAGNRVRINAQLIDANSGTHVWAERYDRELLDLFDLQDEISETLVAALQGEVGEFERERAHRKPPESLDAWESYQRGLWHLWRWNAEDHLKACQLFRRSSEQDPNFAQPVAALGYTLALRIHLSYTNSPREVLEEALQLASRAVELDDKEALAHHTLGRVQLLRGEFGAAIAELRTAIDLNPSLALAHFGLAMALFLSGQPAEAISEIDTAIRLSPRDPVIWAFFGVRALTQVFLRDYESAVADARRAIRHAGAAFHSHASLASALAHLDRHEEAKVALGKLLEVKPDFSLNDVPASYAPLSPEAVRPLFETLFDGLRKAGFDTPNEPIAAE